MSAHFHVIIAASALTSSSVTHRVEAHAALERAEQVVVLDAVALEEPDLAAVHLHGEVDDELVLRLAQDRLRRSRARLIVFDARLEVVLDDLEEVVLLVAKVRFDGAAPGIALGGRS